MSRKSIINLLEKVIQSTQSTLDTVSSKLETVSSILRIDSPETVSKPESVERNESQYSLGLKKAKRRHIKQPTSLDIIKGYPSFDKKWKYPTSISYLDIEVVPLSFNQLSTVKPPFMPDIPEKYVITVQGELALKKEPSIIWLAMRNVFDTISFCLIQSAFNWDKEKSDTVLSAIIEKIQKDTGWTWNETLFAILIRDFITPGIKAGRACSESGLEDTLRIYITKGNILYFASFPYNSPSLELGQITSSRHFGQNDFGGGYDEDYPPGDYDLGTPI